MSRDQFSAISLMPRYLLQYPATPPVPVGINVIGTVRVRRHVVKLYTVS